MNRRRIACIWVLLLMFESAILAQTESDRYPFIKNDKLGFIDGRGHEVISAQFGNAGDAKPVSGRVVRTSAALVAGVISTNRANLSSSRNSGGHTHFPRVSPVSCCLKKVRGMDSLIGQGA